MRPSAAPGARVAPRRVTAAVAAAVAAAVYLLVLATACGGIPSSEAPVQEETYVAVTARLSLLTERTGGPVAPPDTVVARARSAILAEAGVTQEELLEFARRVGDEPGRMQELWSAVASEADSLEAAGWAPPGFPAPADTAATDSAPGRGRG